MGKQPALAVAFLLISVSAYGQTAPPQFDAVSVKVAGLEDRTGVLFEGGPGTTNPGRLTVRDATMRTLLTKAFDVGPDQIQGPKWLTDYSGPVHYNFEATMPPDTTKEQFLKMLQNMLAERFHLVFRRETRNFPGYELVVDKGGPKFKEVEPDPNLAPATTVATGFKVGEDGFPARNGPNTISVMGASLMRTKYQERTMAEFVSALGSFVAMSQGKRLDGNYLLPRVVDRTGLTGKYTFILESAGPALPPGLPSMPALANGADNSVAAASDPSGAPDIFTAIQKQLGLRLDKTADVPLDYIVIENLEKTPTPN